VLLDLGGHTAGNRLTVFGWKPAPVQVTYVGFPSSTGMRSMGWRISDAWADPVGMTERYHTEKLARLAEAFYCYRPHDEAPEVAELPALTNRFVTMGSMNAFRKVTPAMIEVWTGILREVPTARLLMVGSGDAAADQRVRESMGDAGKRVEILGRSSRAEYLRLYQRVDFSLDPYPFNGHTTSCDSLWMGAPVVTLAGKTAASRAGVSVLNNVRLPELVAETPEQYRAIAVELARDVDRLRELRPTLRERMARSVIGDATRVTGHLEEAYLEMLRAAGAS
jgi:protein O-GlcNAc transferase